MKAIQFITNMILSCALILGGPLFMAGLNAQEPTLKSTLEIGGYGVRSVAFSGDGKFLLATTSEGSVDIWDLATNKQVASPRETNGKTAAAAFSPDGKTVAYPEKGRLVFWDVSKRKPAGNIPTGGDCDDIILNSDGTQVIAANVIVIQIWNVKTRKSVAVIPKSTKAADINITHDGTDLSISSDGKMLAVSSTVKKSVKIWDLPTRREKFDLQCKAAAYGVAVGYGDKLVAAACGDVVIWDATNGKEKMTIKSPNGEAVSVCFNRQGGLLAFSSDDGQVHLWRATEEKIVQSFKAHNKPIYAMQFSHDGKLLATGSEDETAKLWDVSGVNAGKPQDK